MRMINSIGIIALCVYMSGTVLSTPINSDDDNAASKHECSTTACKTERLRSFFSILSYANESVSPCENFYDYVCGNYEKVSNRRHNNLPYRMIRKDDDNVVNKKLYDSIKKIDVTTEKSRPRKLVKGFFDMCMDKKTRQDRGLKSFSEIIDKLHGWPMYGNGTWNEENWRWENVYEEAIKLGVPTDIFLLHIDIRKEHSPSSALRLIPISNHRSSYYLLEHTLYKEPGHSSRVEEEFSEASEFGVGLLQEIRGYHDTSAEKNLTYLRENYPNIDWNKLFDLSAYGIKIDNPSEPIFIENMEFLDYVKTHAIPKRVLANYQMSRFFKYAVPYLHWDFNEYYIYWQNCLKSVRESLPHITDAIYIQDHFDKDIKNNVLEMIENIKKQYIKASNSISWFDQTAPNFTIGKIEAMKTLVAYPDEVYDNDFLDKFYKDYELVEGDYFKTALNFNFQTQKRRMLQYKTYDYTSYEAMSSWIDSFAYNFYQYNILRIYAGYLQGENYNKYRPMYMNYGTLGRKIAQEMFRAFDSRGVDYSKNGEHKFLYKYISPIIREYEKEKDCLNDHYEKYDYKSGIRWWNTYFDETLGDVNGIRIAYHAYQQWVKENGPEPNFPYGNFTPNQLYWMSFAHSHCEFSSPGTPVSYYTLENRFRVIGSVSHSPEFSVDFHCPINSKMNLENKCTFD